MDTLTERQRVSRRETKSQPITARQLTRYRREDVGFVFQFYNLIPNLTALENVEMATELAKAPFSAEQVLNDVGLSERMINFPAQLSGGEQQRVAIARAVAKKPEAAALRRADRSFGRHDGQAGAQNPAGPQPRKRA